LNKSSHFWRKIQKNFEKKDQNPAKENGTVKKIMCFLQKQVSHENCDIALMKHVHFPLYGIW